jgi:hypothetical protein
MPDCTAYKLYGLFVGPSNSFEMECLVCVGLIPLGIAREFASVAGRNLLLT